ADGPETEREVVGGSGGGHDAPSRIVATHNLYRPRRLVQYLAEIESCDTFVALPDVLPRSSCPKPVSRSPTSPPKRGCRSPPCPRCSTAAAMSPPPHAHDSRSTSSATATRGGRRLSEASR